MGASFLSKPVTRKHSSYEENDKLKCGLSSMQGWRLDQEDAHNCILNFDTDTSFFAVYDGHGGREVAEYCSQKLPDFIKNTPAYKEGDIERALIEGFLEFDKTLCTPEVVNELKKLQKNIDGDGEEESDVEENVKHLYEEAAMPIEEVIKKYKKSNEDDKEGINILIPKRKGQSIVDSSTSSGPDAVASSSTQDTCSSTEAGTSKEENEAECKVDDKQSPQSNGTATSTSHEGSSSKAEETNDACKVTASVQNGEISEDQSKESNDCNVQENTVTDKGKGKAVLKKADQPPKNKRHMRTRIAKEVYKALLEFDQEEEDDSEDEEDKTFEGPNENSSEDDEEESVNPHIEEVDSEGSGVEEEEEDDEVEEDEEECNEEEEDLDDEPGYKSGCTAVVGLLKGNELYVANIGDSRCLVCRKGEVVEMSDDHKPEKDIELKRIKKAGGNVNSDYRINNGLNLSRAFGDFSYKQNKTLSDREQMVIALPDIRKLTIDPDSDEFMIFACDGIWNSLKNEEVVELLRPNVIACKEAEQLSKAVEELIDRCFDPDSAYGDTGNDNMTAIVVKFAKKKPSLKRSASASPTPHGSKMSKTEGSPDTTAA